MGTVVTIHVVGHGADRVEQTERKRSVDDALAWAGERQVVRRQPHLLEREGVRMLVLPGDPLHPDPIEEVPVETRFVFVDRRWRAERAHT